MKRSASLSILILILAACANRAAPSADSGVRGIVLLGPTCPVVTEESPCPDTPLADTEIQVLRGGDEEASVRSADDGRFAVALKPGHYVLQAMVEAGGPGMFAKPLEVDVSANAWVDVTVSVDTGIR
ncbi:MAG: hypothetical protein ACRDHS_05335 [Actinomycetota bacterium]